MSDATKLPKPDLATANRETFETFFGQTFEIASDDGRVTLTLDNINVFGSLTVRDNHLEIDGAVLPPSKAFALTLEGPREPVREAMMHTLRQDEIGEIELSLSAFRQDHDCILYESVFNQK